ncbi:MULTISPECIES: hypothetical protein [Flagellimonas]|uniref:Uncharacterized protein n=1 Tax=Flagellimonas olearia TaxID=552546 RepID=A0A444VI32_9FLAO|nr:hypothetical protein [Allomuricauda olearia]RYC50421.1 hypothetical protein DN53_05745 [Allomuricauda olearia]
MLSSEHFYNYFQLNHFDYKQESNRYLLEMDEETFPRTFKGIINGNRKDYDRTIRMDIRFTFLLSVEALFEFIFALLPEKDGTMNDKRILQRLAQRKHNNEEIRKFAKGEKNILDETFSKILFFTMEQEERQMPFIQHLFYAGVEQDKVKHDISKCVDVIYRSLKVLASELANRTELNSYKHGLKAIPFFKTIEVFDPETEERLMEYDMENTLTNYVWDAKNKVSRFETQALDYERDILLTHWTSNLIANMVQSRKSMFDSGKGKSAHIMFFSEKEWERIKKANVKAQRFTMKFEHDS